MPACLAQAPVGARCTAAGGPRCIARAPPAAALGPRLCSPALRRAAAGNGGARGLKPLATRRAARMATVMALPAIDGSTFEKEVLKVG